MSNSRKSCRKNDLASSEPERSLPRNCTSPSCNVSRAHVNRLRYRTPHFMQNWHGLREMARRRSCFGTYTHRLWRTVKCETACQRAYWARPRRRAPEAFRRNFYIVGTSSPRSSSLRVGMHHSVIQPRAAQHCCGKGLHTAVIATTMGFLMKSSRPRHQP